MGHESLLFRIFPYEPLPNLVSSYLSIFPSFVPPERMNRDRLLLFFLVSILLSGSLHLDAVAQDTLDRKRFGRWALRDAGRLVQSLEPQHALYTAGFLGGLALFSTQDEAIRDAVQQNFNRDLFAGPNEAGGPLAPIPVAAIFAISLSTDNAKFQDASFTSLQALLYSYIAVFPLKYAIGRARPFQDEGPHTFAPFSGNSSFPSGHTSSIFAIVTPWFLYYPNVLTGSLFLLATGTGISRIGRDAHWPTDVIAGGTLGFLIGYGLTKLHQADQSDPSRFNLSVAPSRYGMMMHLSLKL